MSFSIGAPARTVEGYNKLVTQGLVYHWTMNDAGGYLSELITGSAAAFTGSGYTAEVSGKIGTSYFFDGTGSCSYARGITGWNYKGPVTLVMWACVAGPSGRRSTIGGATSTSSTSVRFMSHVGYFGNTIYWDYGTANSSCGRISTSYTCYDKWTHIALLSEGDGGSYKAIYLDGQKVAEDTGPSDGPDTTPNFDIGRACVVGASDIYYWTGSLDDVRIYKRLLTPKEIKALAGVTP